MDHRIVVTALWFLVVCGLGIAGKVTVTINGSRHSAPWWIGVWAAPLLMAAIGFTFYGIGWAMTWPIRAWLP